MPKAERQKLRPPGGWPDHKFEALDLAVRAWSIERAEPEAVQVEVALPDRRTRSVIDRDRYGNIMNVVQTETSE